MKQLTLRLSLVAALLGGLLLSHSAQAQTGKSSETPHKIGLIDIAYIFKNYQKFTDQREDLKKEIQNSDARAKQMVLQLQSLQKKLKDPKFAKDSPQVKAWRQQFIELTAKYQGYRQEEQQKFLDKESQIYKTIYLEVADAVRTYAKYYNFTLILRFNREGVADAKDAKTILSRLNGQVIYVQDGLDITEVILNYLNDKYKKSLRGTQSAGGTRPRN